jgi:hypothetical protein
MAYRTRIKYTDEQKTKIWDRWKRGETLKEIGRAFDRGSSSIYGQKEKTAPSPFLKEPDQETLWWVDRDKDTEKAKEEVVDSMAAMRARLEAAAAAK